MDLSEQRPWIYGSLHLDGLIKGQGGAVRSACTKYTLCLLGRAHCYMAVWKLAERTSHTGEV